METTFAVLGLTRRTMSPRSRRTLLSAALLSMIALSVGAQSTTQQEDNTLAAAIAAGKVTARFTGTGASSGDAVRVIVQKTAAAGPGTRTLTIPPGTLLRSSNPSEQNMVIAGIRGRQLDAQRFTPQLQIVLTGTAAVTYVLEAYCADFHKGNPSATTGFTLTAPDSRLSAIVAEGKKRNLSTRALQAAIWIATDNVSYEQVNVRFPLSPSEWQSGRQQVKPAIDLISSQQRTPAGGQPLPASSRGYEIEAVPPGESLPIIGPRSPVGTTVQIGDEAIFTDDQLKLVGEWIASCSKRFGKTVKEPRIMEQLVAEFVQLVGFEKASKAGLIFFGSEGSSDYRWPAVAKKPTGGPNPFPVKAEGKSPRLLPPKVGQELEKRLGDNDVRLAGPIGNMRMQGSVGLPYQALSDLDATFGKGNRLIVQFSEGARIKLLGDADFGEMRISKDSILTKTKAGWMCEEPGPIAGVAITVPTSVRPAVGRKPTTGPGPFPGEAKGKTPKLLSPKVGQELEDALTYTKTEFPAYLGVKPGKRGSVGAGSEIRASRIACRVLTRLDFEVGPDGYMIYRFREGARVQLLADGDVRDTHIPKDSILAKTKAGWVCEEPGGGPAAAGDKTSLPAADPFGAKVASPTVFQGTNPNGDTILWDSGKTWKGVTITGLERKSTGTLLAIKETPAGFPAGKYRDFKEVALRGAQLPAPPVANPIDAVRLYSVGYSPQSPTNLGPFAPHDDSFFTKWWGVTQWDSLAVKPENAAPIQNQDGAKVLAQFRVTITHIAVKDGNCYLLVRRNAGQMLPEGWYCNIDEAIFQRESPGTKR